MRTILFLAAAALSTLPLSNSPLLAQEPAKLPAPEISEELSIPRHSVDVLGSQMSYLETGSGEPVLFIHGNPTSAYLWRNIMPYVADDHRAIAIDLIGMGHSGKPDIAYSYEDHYRYLAAFIDKLGLEGITLVAHDWGAALAWDFARQNPGRIKRIAFMEGVLPPSFPIPSYEAMGPTGEALRALRDPEQGRELVIGQNMFVEQMLPGFVNRPLGEQAMREYRLPYLAPGARLPTLQWPRELPIGGEPAEAERLMADIAAFMRQTEKPTLFFYASPGVVGPAAVADWYSANLKQIETLYVGQGLHFIQEDQPEAIGRGLRDWIRRN